MTKWLIVAGAVALGMALRVACLGAELWLDEIWSWDQARQAGSPWGVLTLRHDNNHPLNSLWLLAVPRGAALPWYRLHVLLAGLATILVGARVAARFGAPEAAFTSVLLAGSYWLVLTSTEARGYALALLFALAAFDALWAYLNTHSRLALAAFWVLGALGFLSHLTFALAYAGFIVWSLRRFAQQRMGPGDEVRQMVRCHAGPGLFFIAFYLTTVRGMEVGGGPPVSVIEVVSRLLSQGWGGPVEGWAALVIAPATLALAALALRRLARRGDVWVFFAVAVFAAPALFLVRRPPVLYERYLFIPYVYFLLLLGVTLGGLWRERGWWARAGVLALAAVFLAGNVNEVAQYLRTGRGHFREALAYVVEQSGDGPITLAGDVDVDRDFRTRTYVGFYAPRVAGREVDYRRDGPVEWVILHRLEPWLDGRPLPGGEVTYRDARYRLVWSAPPEGVAWGWYVYRRE